MKRRFAPLTLVAVVWCAGLVFSPSVFSQATPPAEQARPADDEKEGCIRNLKLIYAAIQAYKMDHKDVPNWLSDLVPQYLDDPSVLICPVCKRTGQTETGAFADPKISSSYLYQFCPLPLGSELPDNPTKTRRDWKRRQMGLVGSVVPLVRCKHHGVVLNLAFDGHVYESGALWETTLTNQVNVADLRPKPLFAEDAKPVEVPKSEPVLIFPPRDSQAKAALLDLTAYYNARLNDFWLGATNNNLGSLTPGLQKFGGTDFDARGVIQLAARSSTGKNFPKQIKGIKVQQKCNQLHFLHAAVNGKPTDDGNQVGSYTVHFVGNPAVFEIPIAYGHDVSDWRERPGEPDPAGLTTVWSGTNAPGHSMRLFTTTWTNLIPTVEVESIDFNSAASGPAPFLVAITAE